MSTGSREYDASEIDDLIERLRLFGITEHVPFEGLRNEAADAIDSLRAQLVAAKVEIERHNQHMKTIPTMQQPDSPESGLRFLAVWFDAMYPNDDDRQVQEDLIRWANEIEVLKGQLEAAQTRIEELENSGWDSK